MEANSYTDKREQIYADRKKLFDDIERAVKEFEKKYRGDINTFYIESYLSDKPPFKLMYKAEIILTAD